MCAVQVRLFDSHLGGVIAKGTLLPLNSGALPAGTIVLRQSQVKAPAGKSFWPSWVRYWQTLLVWAHQQHQAQQQHQQQQWRPTLGDRHPAGSCNVAGPNSSSSGSGSCSNGAAAPSAVDAAVRAAATAAASGPRADTLRCFNAQDQPWMQQLWYIHDAQELVLRAAQSGGSCSDPPTPPGCPQRQLAQQPQHHQQAVCGASGVCACSATLEVVSRPPDSNNRAPDLRVNKNLLLLLHHAGVPQEVFAR